MNMKKAFALLLIALTVGTSEAKPPSLRRVPGTSKGSYKHQGKLNERQTARFLEKKYKDLINKDQNTQISSINAPLIVAGVFIATGALVVISAQK